MSSNMGTNTHFWGAASGVRVRGVVWSPLDTEGDAGESPRGCAGLTATGAGILSLDAKIPSPEA